MDEWSTGRSVFEDESISIPKHLNMGGCCYIGSVALIVVVCESCGHRQKRNIPKALTFPTKTWHHTWLLKHFKPQVRLTDWLSVFHRSDLPRHCHVIGFALFVTREGLDYVASLLCRVFHSGKGSQTVPGGFVYASPSLCFYRQTL